MKVAITIPAFNEEKTIGGVISDINRVMGETGLEYFVHVQDDGSTDGTGRIAIEKGCILHTNPSRTGLANTFRREVDNCIALGADIIVHVDADGQYDVTAIPALISGVMRGADLVIGSRFMKGARCSISKTRKYGNIAFTALLNLAYGTHQTDISSGLRAFTRKTAEDIRVTTCYTYTHQQVIKAAKSRKKIVEVPVNSYRTRESRLFKNVFEYVIKSSIDLIKSG
jgi:glycosyltransferase involved in cell wall biosynthesis